MSKARGMGSAAKADAASEPRHGINPAIAELAVPIGEVQNYPGNARRHAMPTIVESLRTNGQYKPITVQASTGFVLAGNGTLLAARELGWTHIARSFVDCDEQTARRVVAVDNKASDDAGYDNEALAALLAGLEDLTGSGFVQAEIDALLADVTPRAALTGPDDVPDKPIADPVSRLGDVWVLGPHRLLCGDSTNLAAVEVMLDGDRCEAMWTDPPYGVSYVGGTGLTIQNDGADGLPELLAGAFAVATAALRPGAPFYIAHPAGPKSLPFYDAMLAAGWLFRQQLVWVKNALVLGQTDYHYRHEPILAGETPPAEEPEDEAQHDGVLYGFTPGASGRLGRGGPRWHGDNKQTTVFEVPKPPRNADHPTMKPIALITAMLSNSCRPGGLVFEPFGGSGSTLIACHTLGMVARVVELDPAYVDVICRRYQEHTGVLPVLASTGDAVDFVALAASS